ncbi:MAG: protein kinase [Terriglobia bacterium]
MIGQTLGHYRIIEKIGAGGMGEVYRARDERLDRDVAVKVLPAGTLADEAARKRFRKEALALSKLNHPNIQTVHDFDTQDGIDFLVTEYVPGVTLSDRLGGKPLPEKEALRLGQQFAEGLAAAHEQGIIHRDLKPSNLRVTPDGRLKVLDFGVAKLVRPPSPTATTESLTETQSIAGTPLYMAPEQKLGEPVDARTDIYAAGLVLREMATGQPPLRPGEGPPKYEGISPRLQPILEKCLEKEPENRYQSAKELQVDLRRLAISITPSPVAPATGIPGSPRQVPGGSARWVLRTAGVVLALVVLSVAGYFGWQRFTPRATPPEGKIMLAVLPFENLSGDPEQEYFSDGLTEEMIAQLGGLHPERLGVIARTSAMKYKNTDKAIDEIGRELGVHYILEGSVRREGDRVRITAQLIQVRDQTHLWAESYERDLKNIFAVQSGVAQRVARSLELALLPGERARLADVRPVDPQAYEAYLKGRYYLNQWGTTAFKKGIEYFRQAIDLDPTYAPAYAGLGDSYMLLSLVGSLPPQETYPKAKAAALKALELDDTLGEAHAALGSIKFFFDWDFPEAQREFQRARELSPSNADAHASYGAFLTLTARFEEGIAEAQRALELDPLSPLFSENLGWAYFYARRYEESIAQYQKVLERDPQSPHARARLALNYAMKGMNAAAISECENVEALPCLYVYAVSGKSGEALKNLEELEELSTRRYVDPFWIAGIYAGLGDKDRAFHWLRKAYEQHSTSMVFLKTLPELDSLRDDPRFQDLLRRMNFPGD